jgi:hypothetical protein
MLITGYFPQGNVLKNTLVSEAFDRFLATIQLADAVFGHLHP